MGSQDNSYPLLAKLLDEVMDRPGSLWVQTKSWLIKEENIWLVEESPGYINPLLHTSGEGSSQVLSPLLHLNQFEQSIYLLFNRLSGKMI